MIQIMRSWTKVRGRLAHLFDMHNNSSFCSSWWLKHCKLETYFCRIVFCVIFIRWIKCLLILHKIVFYFFVFQNDVCFQSFQNCRFHTCRINFSIQAWSDTWTWNNRNIYWGRITFIVFVIKTSHYAVCSNTCINVMLLETIPCCFFGLGVYMQLAHGFDFVTFARVWLRYVLYLH